MTAEILAVAESAESAQSIVRRLGSEFDGAVGISTGSLREIVAAAAEASAKVVLLGLGTVAANERAARALRDAARSRPPLLLMLCSAGELAAAHRLASDGVFDHYLPHPDEFDPGRLAISARLGLRLAGAAAPHPQLQRPAPAQDAGASPFTTARARPVLLMVEDDEYTQQLLAVTLASHDLELVFESDGTRALHRIRELRPDLVLMDVLLPGADGVGLTRDLKRDPELASTPVVMVTGEARREILMRSMEAGAADFIVKPFGPDALVAKLGRFLPSLR